MSDDALIDRVLGSDARLLGRVLEAAAAVDRETGAPAPVRAAVGAATKAEDRLATLRRFAPDAEPHGADNFIFTHPTTRRRTLYNPPGLDLGDVASVTPEVGEMLGGAVGGFLGAPAGPVGLAGGVGLGAAAGREIATLGAQAFSGTQDSRSLPQHLTDTATTAGLNATAVPAGNALAGMARWALGPVSRMFGARTGRQALDDFANAGVDASAGAVTGNRAVQLGEATLEAAPGSATRMRTQGETQAGQAADEARRIAQGYGPPADPVGAGATIRQGAQDAAQRFEQRQGQLYDTAFGMIPADARAPLGAVDRLGAQVRAELAQAPESRRAVLQPVLARIEALAADAAEGGVPFEALRAIRTDLGRLIGGPPNAASAPASDTMVYLRQLYGALTDDMRAAVQGVSPDADRALSLADRYTRLNRTQNLPVLEDILNKKTDEQVYRMLFPANGKPDAQALARIRRNMTPDQWNTLAATVVDRLGMATAGTGTEAGEFSVNTFLTNWRKLMQNGEGARNVMFGGGGQNAQLAADLDRLARVTGRLRDAQAMRNYSGTARVLGMGAAGLSAGQDVLEGDWQGLATIGALGVLAPNMAARLITNPGFVRWLAGATPQVAANPALADRALVRLGAVAEANPQIRDALDAFRLTFTGGMPARIPSAQPSPTR